LFVIGRELNVINHFITNNPQTYTTRIAASAITDMQHLPESDYPTSRCSAYKNEGFLHYFRHRSGRIRWQQIIGEVVAEEWWDHRYVLLLLLTYGPASPNSKLGLLAEHRQH
jgi:hypothetical protein